MPFQRDQRLVASQERSIKHSFVWPTWDFTHPGEAAECPRELGQLTLLSPKEAIRLFGVPEVHAITRDNSSGFAGQGVIFGAQLPHEGVAGGEAEIHQAVSVAIGLDGWLHAPCERQILVVSVDGERVVQRAALQQLAPPVTGECVCPVKSVVI